LIVGISPSIHITWLYEILLLLIRNFWLSWIHSFFRWCTWLVTYPIWLSHLTLFNICDIF
jgi:hypothetical protein